MIHGQEQLVACCTIDRYEKLTTFLPSSLGEADRALGGGGPAGPSSSWASCHRKAARCRIGLRFCPGYLTVSIWYGAFPRSVISSFPSISVRNSVGER